MASPAPAIIILAGGKASRMGGGDKGLCQLAGRTLLERIVERMAPQGSAIVLNANADPIRFANLGIPIIADSVAAAGPLGGLLAGMEWAASQIPALADIVTVPTDTPFLPHDLVRRLITAKEASGATIALAVSGKRLHPVIALWPVRLAAQLRQALSEAETRKVGKWIGNFTVAEARFEIDPIDPFLNINTLDDLAAAETLLRAFPG